MAAAIKRRTGSFSNLTDAKHSPPLTIIPTSTATPSNTTSSSMTLTPTTPSYNKMTMTSTTTTPPACPGASLYHTCRIVLDKLALIPDMLPWLTLQIDDSLSPSLTAMNTSSTTMDSKLISNDPLTKLCLLCRRGIPLSILFNALGTNQPLKIDVNSKLTQVNSCKASVYHFLVACRDQLLFSEEEVFTISDLFVDDTNGFVKVVNTVNRILNLLEDKGIISSESSTSNRHSNPMVPKNMRDQVVLELLSTERKYVQDLETLQNYMRELQQQKILSPDTVHYLFGNLNSLVDFQRRFLIEMEKIAEHEPHQQQFGLLFSSMEQAFSVYEPYCSNYHSAQDLVAQEAPNLQKLNDMVNPTHVLTSLLIKPVQRICKYPLLMNELLKTTTIANKELTENEDDNDMTADDANAMIEDLQEGLEAIKRVTEKVNETQRRQENLQMVDQLKRRVEDWKGISIDNCGPLLLQDKVFFTIDGNPREMHVFYFENRLIFCKEPKDNRLAKTNTISIMKKRRGTLEPKGKIDTNLITSIRNISENGEWILFIEWKDHESKQFTLKFRNEEQCKLWETTLSKQLNQNEQSLLYNDENDNNDYNINHHSMATLTLSEMINSSDNRSFIDADDDEDDLEYVEDDLIETGNNNNNSNDIRSRSNSISAQFRNTFKSKYGRNSNGGSNEEHHGILKPSHHHGRANTPGMNLQPLPRTASSSTSTAYTQSPPLTATATTTDYSFYPSSPPPSNPSSPTGMSRASPNNSQSGRSFRDFQQMQQSADYFIQSIDNATKQGNSRLHQQQHPILPQARSRAQSSPSIHNNNNHPQQQQTIIEKPMKSSARMLKKERSSSMQAQIDHHQQQYYHHHHHQQQQYHHSSPITVGQVNIKIVYEDRKHNIVIPQQTSYDDLLEIVKKILHGFGTETTPNDHIRLKYKDEDGDFITVNSNDDIQMAIESCWSRNIKLFVSL
ncbi:hypothetical protein BJ944DRAFT_243327 [Cunninghamella echinulata]|nr:hypothetical protein BJ944DRAFT_243327 [Cunninghamella echinulata]